MSIITENRLIYQFVKNYSNFYCSETSSTVTFEETIQIKDVDDSVISQAPISKYIEMSFFDYKNDTELLGITNIEKLKEVNGASYTTNSKNIKIVTNINKSIFTNELPHENKYVYFRLSSFIKRYSRLKWNNLENKMFIFILEEVNIDFESDFLIIQSLDKLSGDVYEKIDKSTRERYVYFNSIYSSIYDDKKLSSYFEYPLTWYSLKSQEVENSIKIQMLNHFFKIICNKDLGEDKYLIRGHKTVTIDLINRLIDYKESVIVKELFDFIIDIDKHHDKLSLLRNTMTIFLDNYSDTENFFEKSNEILKSVKYNFDLYIQDKVKLFLDQKNKLLQEFIQTTKKIEDLTNSLVSQIRTVSLSLLGTVFLSLLNDINRGQTAAILNLVLLSYVLYFSLNFLLIFKQKKQKDNLLSSLENYTEALGVIGESNENNLSYDNLKKTYLDKTLLVYTNHRKWILVILVGLILLFILLYISNRFDFFPYPKEMIKIIIGY